MSNHLPGVCSPVRNKRRQSDAKWRASVATCYDVLKYVVPNVKQMSKKKISKALILQECEKHIQDLEDTISYLFHVECKNQGRVALWKEGDYWSQCSMEKLHEDFTEKQRRVFHVSAHGRRCYNLLQDIKEEVFDMKADSKQMAFVSEDSLSLMNDSEDENYNMMGTHTVSVLPFPVDNMNEIVVSELSQTTADQSQSATEKESDTRKQGDVRHVPSNSVSGTNSVQVRQQPRPRQRFFSDNESDVDTALLQGLNDGDKNTGISTHVRSCESAYLLSTDKGTSEKQQIVHGVISAVSTSISGTSSSSSSTSPDKRCISENANSIDQSDDVVGNGDDHRLKLDKLTGNHYDLSKEKDYPFLLGALKAEKEQEVPTMETPIKTTKIKRPRLSSSSADIDFLNGNGGGDRNEIGCVSEHHICTDSTLECDNIYNKCYTSHSVGNKISTLIVGASSFSSLVPSSKSDIKVETDDSSPCINHDPLLSSLNTPKFDADMSLFFWTQYDGVIKRPPKYGSARKREVPTMETPIKTTKIKRPRLSSSSADIDFLNGNGGGDRNEIGCVSEHHICTDSTLECDNIYNKCYTSHSVGNKISTLIVGASSFSSLVPSSKSDIKVETDDSSPCINHDPLLSSLNTPKFDADMSLFFWTQYDGVIKRPPKYGSARKRLNFNSPSYSGWSHTSPGLVHPDRAIPASPVVTGFTPIKLPDDLTRNSDASLEYLASPWKSVSSPFNCRTMPQGFINSSSLVDLEDSLFCMETLDALDFEDGIGSEVTPAPTQTVENTQQPGELLKAKASIVPSEPVSRMKPPCRRRLEGFYDQSTAARDFINLSDESHVVPQLNTTLWTSDFTSHHLDSRAAVDVEDNLVCLETVDTLELDDVDS